MTRAMEGADLRFDELTVVTERLTRIVLAEIKLLKARRPRELEEFTEEKTALSASYARLSNALRRDREVVKAASADRRGRLKTATEAFRKALDDLEARLARARHLSEGLIRAIADDLNANQQKPVGYGAKATPAASGPSRPQAFALNRVV